MLNNLEKQLQLKNNKLLSPNQPKSLMGKKEKPILEPESLIKPLASEKSKRVL